MIKRLRLKETNAFRVGMTCFTLDKGAAVIPRQPQRGFTLLDFGDGLLEWFPDSKVESLFDSIRGPDSDSSERETPQIRLLVDLLIRGRRKIRLSKSVPELPNGMTWSVGMEVFCAGGVEQRRIEYITPDDNGKIAVRLQSVSLPHSFESIPTDKLTSDWEAYGWEVIDRVSTPPPHPLMENRP
jgi:hypothetical protein